MIGNKNGVLSEIKALCCLFVLTKKMEYSVFYSLALFLVVCGVTKAFHSIWWRPKLVERRLKRQGIRGSAYKPLVGDVKEYVKMITEAWSTPMNLNHKIVQRVDPFTAMSAKKYGMFYVWVSFSSIQQCVEEEI